MTCAPDIPTSFHQLKYAQLFLQDMWFRIHKELHQQLPQNHKL